MYFLKLKSYFRNLLCQAVRDILLLLFEPELLLTKHTWNLTSTLSLHPQAAAMNKSNLKAQNLVFCQLNYSCTQKNGMEKETKVQQNN